MRELLPCPRCGSKYVAIFQDGDWWIIHCEPVECSLTSARYRDKNDAIDWWNTRLPKRHFLLESEIVPRWIMICLCIRTFTHFFFGVDDLPSVIHLITDLFKNH